MSSRDRERRDQEPPDPSFPVACFSILRRLNSTHAQSLRSLPQETSYWPNIHKLKCLLLITVFLALICVPCGLVTAARILVPRVWYPHYSPTEGITGVPELFIIRKGLDRGVLFDLPKTSNQRGISEDTTVTPNLEGSLIDTRRCVSSLTYCVFYLLCDKAYFIYRMHQKITAIRFISANSRRAICLCAVCHLICVCCEFSVRFICLGFGQILPLLISAFLDYKYGEFSTQPFTPQQPSLLYFHTMSNPNLKNTSSQEPNSENQNGLFSEHNNPIGQSPTRESNPNNAGTGGDGHVNTQGASFRAILQHGTTTRYPGLNNFSFSFPDLSASDEVYEENEEDDDFMEFEEAMQVSSSDSARKRRYSDIQVTTSKFAEGSSEGTK